MKRDSDQNQGMAAHAVHSGRPAKFNEPRKPVTMTLPQRILDLLALVNRDRALAVTELVEKALMPSGKPTEPVREMMVGKGKSLLTVADSPSLRSLPWISLIEISPGMHLLSVESGVPTEKLELAIVDLLEESKDPRDSEILRELLQRLRTPRRNHKVKKEEILFVEKN